MNIQKKIASVLILAVALVMPIKAVAWCAGYDFNSCQAEAETKLRDDLGQMYYWCYNYGPGIHFWDQDTCDEAYRLYNNSIVDCNTCYADIQQCAWWDWFCDWENNWLW